MVPLHPVPKPRPDQPVALPADPLCYLVGSDGLYKQVRNEFYSARVKAAGVGGLAEIGEAVELNVPKLPLELLRAAEAFFIAAYRKHQSEAVVLLLANPKIQEWRVEVPPQEVHGAHVSYDLSKLPEPPTGFQRFGSIHSHANMKAFHSSTDDSDEAAFDGLHITIGNVDEPIRSYSARWVLAGHVFKAELAEAVEMERLPEPDPAWLEMVRPVPVYEGSFGGWAEFGQMPAPAATRQQEMPLLEPYGPVDMDEFGSPEEYEQYLLDLRDEVEERLAAVRIEPRVGTSP